jgi:hypothetical protein
MGERFEAGYASIAYSCNEKLTRESEAPEALLQERAAAQAKARA